MKIIIITIAALVLSACSEEPPNRSFGYFSKKDFQYAYKFNTQLEPLFKKELKEFNLVRVVGSLPKYSPVIDPYQIGTFGINTKRSDNDVDGNFHTGTDLISLSGNRFVYSTANGIVVYQETSQKLGNVIVVRHTNGIETLYTHLENSYVKVADKVNVNTVLGQYGISGEATQPHLHYEILVGGYPVDPIKATQLNPDYEEYDNPDKQKKLFKRIEELKDYFATSIKYKANIRLNDDSLGIIDVIVSYKDDKVAIKMVKFYGNSEKQEEIINDCKFFNKNNWKCKYLHMSDGHLFLDEPNEKSIIYIPRAR